MMDEQIVMIWNYCAANDIKFTFDFDDKKVEFTFPTDLIAQRVKAGLNQPNIERRGSNLIVWRLFRGHGEDANLVERAKKIYHILITIMIMTSLYIGIFIWWIVHQ